MENILNEKQWKDGQQEDDQQVKVWMPMPEDHRLFIICAVLSAAMVVLGVLLVWGWIVAAVAAVLMILLGIYVHFKQQKRLKMEKAIIYLEKGEMFLISLHKGDTELEKYLRGKLDVDLTGKFPGQALLDLAEFSVICHISRVSNIFQKKEDMFMMYVTYELYPYPYTGNMEIPVKKKCYENFEGLMELAYSKKVH